jgi:diguanylate cyclase (GGDEF)-like protein/PAS domain S-box-containing protein
MTAVKKDGARFEAELTASLIRDENGQPAGLMASFVDITERNRAAELLKLNEMRLNSLLTLSQQLYGMRVEDIAQAALEEAVRLTGSAIGYCHLVNEDQEAIELVNWSRQALEGCRAVSDKHYPLSNAGIWADCVREQRPVVHNDYPALRDKRGLPEGHSPLLRHASAPVVEGGKVRLIMGVGNKPGDYDEADLLQLQLVANETWKLVQRKRIEERLQYSEERFRSMVSNVPGVIYRCERHMPWHMLYVSDEIEKLSGYPVSDFLEGRRFFADLLLPEDLGDELISRQVEAHLPYEIEYRIRRADGQIRWVFERGIASYGPQGEVQWLDGVMIDITERMALQQQLEELATTDPLTGVFNRRCFMERLEDEVQRARRYGSPLSLLIFDLDLFKQINDSYGHDAGDMALKQVATLTRQGLRQVDSLGRLGGEEFAVLLPNTRLDEAAILAERLRARIAAKQLEARDGSFHVTVSGGVTQFYSTIPDGDTLMKHADRALYQAKSAGRNCVRKYQNNLHAL